MTFETIFCLCCVKIFHTFNSIGNFKTEYDYKAILKNIDVCLLHKYRWLPDYLTQGQLGEAVINGTVIF